MTTLNLKISPQQLLQAISQVETPELEEMAYEISLLRARRMASSLPKTEAELLRRIGKTTLSELQRQRLHLLGAKMEAHDLSEVERMELVALSEQSEQLNAERLQLVHDLALLRGQSFVEVMTELGLFNPNVPQTNLAFTATNI